MHFQQILLLILPIWVKAGYLPNCAEDNILFVSGETKTINSPNYPPYGFNVPSACERTLVAPIYHELSGSCYYYIGNRSTNCDPNDSFWIQTDGTGNLANSNVNQYCGTDQWRPIKSKFNSITIGHTAYYWSGFYQCNFTAIPLSGCDCGERIKPRIVAGERAVENAYRYMAVLIESGTNSVIRGGATIITTSLVVTASHVFKWRNGQWMQPPDVKVSVGRNDLTKDVTMDTPCSRSYDVEQIITHPGYDYEKSLNDIALVRVKGYFSFNQCVGVACLPGPNEPVDLYYDQRVTLMGFGMNDYGGSFPMHLKVAGNWVLPNPQCLEKYDDLTDQDLCTTSKGIDRNDTCQGDSGGPIILPAYRDFIIATVKDGLYCGVNPGKCQRVSPYRPWFEQMAKPYDYFCFYKN